MKMFLLLLMFGFFVFWHSWVKFQCSDGPGNSAVQAFLRRLVRQEIMTQNIGLNRLVIV